MCRTSTFGKKILMVATQLSLVLVGFLIRGRIITGIKPGPGFGNFQHKKTSSFLFGLLSTIRPLPFLFLITEAYPLQLFAAFAKVKRKPYFIASETVLESEESGSAWGSLIALSTSKLTCIFGSSMVLPDQRTIFSLLASGGLGSLGMLNVSTMRIYPIKGYSHQSLILLMF